MFYKKILILYFIFQISFTGNSQVDSLKVKSNFYKKSILPVSLILGGALISSSSFEKSFQKNIRNAVGNDFGFAIDDYTRYVPILQLYTADILGVKAKNHWFDQTKNLTLSIIITDFITYRLKKGIYKTRPNGSNDGESFPSGHASFAFTNAAVLYQEFKDSSPLLAYSGYGFATTTAAFRVINNAHWISDVLVSSGIGIFVAKIIYLFDPIIKWNPFKNTKNINFIPQIQNEQYGFYLSVNF